MDVERPESVHERSDYRYWDDSPVDDLDVDGGEKLKETSKHQSKDKKKNRREEKDSGSRDKDYLKTSDELKDRDKEDKDFSSERISTREKKKEDKHREKGRDRDKDKTDRGKEREHDREIDPEKDSERGQDKERVKEKNRGRDKEKEREKEKTRDRDRARDREKEKEKERIRDREKEREYVRGGKEKGKEKLKERERKVDRDSDKSRDRVKMNRRNKDDACDRSKNEPLVEDKDGRDDEFSKQKGSLSEEEGMITELEMYVDTATERPNQSMTELEERISKMKEERFKRKSEGAHEILSWVNKSRVLEEKMKAEKAKALQRSKILEEQDQVVEDDSGDETIDRRIADGLGGVKVLHGLDKVMEGGSVVLTLKDQNILANGDVNEDVDMLENVEIGEQKRRDNAYEVAKKRTGIYDDKFNDEPGSEKKILPQYNDEVAEEGVALDASGRFSGEAERKLEELRRRLKGSSVSTQVDDLTTSTKVASDYYTQEELLKFKKPKKKKSLRKKEKLDLDALEAEAISAGLGASDLGSRNDAKRQAAREEQERSEAERRNSAYQAAYAKADEASRALRMEQALATQHAEDIETPVFADDAEDLQKSLERARKLALKKQSEESASGPEALAHLAYSKTVGQPGDNPDAGESLENKVVITEMEEFVQGLQLDEEAHEPSTEDVFMEEDETSKALEEGHVEGVGGQKDSEEEGEVENEDYIVPDETIQEAPVGKGIAGALKLLKDRGALKETVEWGGRNMDKKKSKLVGIYDEEGKKEIRIERTDEYGRILTPKEAFRQLSHRFHGKGPGKMKQEKRLRQREDEMKLKKMKNSDTPALSVERMREALAQSKMPHIILSGNFKPEQTSDLTSGFGTVGKDLPGGLTPMLGEKKVEHFLGIKRKAGPANSGLPKKPKT